MQVFSEKIIRLSHREKASSIQDRKQETREGARCDKLNQINQVVEINVISPTEFKRTHASKILEEKCD